MNLQINKEQVAQNLHELAVANNVTDSQMADFIFRNFYVPVEHLRISQRIQRHAVAITNLASQL